MKINFKLLYSAIQRPSATIGKHPGKSLAWKDQELDHWVTVEELCKMIVPGVRQLKFICKAKMFSASKQGKLLKLVLNVLLWAIFMNFISVRMCSTVVNFIFQSGSQRIASPLRQLFINLEPMPNKFLNWRIYTRMK